MVLAAVPGTATTATTIAGPTIIPIVPTSGVTGIITDTRVAATFSTATEIA